MVCAAFDACFHSEMGQVKQITRQVVTFLLDNISSLSEEEAFDLKLVYSELLVNAVKHGNKMDQRKRVQLFVKVTGNEIYSEIVDDGAGFNYNKVMAWTKSAENQFAETGRGLLLTQSLTDSLSFNRTGNQVSFYKQVGRNEMPLAAS